jgi:transposase-like protein
MRSKLTAERAEAAEGLVAEGLTLDAIAAQLGVHRQTILRWVDRCRTFLPRRPSATTDAAVAVRQLLSRLGLPAGPISQQLLLGHQPELLGVAIRAAFTQPDSVSRDPAPPRPAAATVTADADRS